LNQFIQDEAAKLKDEREKEMDENFWYTE